MQTYVSDTLTLWRRQHWTQSDALLGVFGDSYRILAIHLFLLSQWTESVLRTWSRRT